jgi:Beta-ketoacyl synthase, N-terminal domain
MMAPLYISGFGSAIPSADPAWQAQIPANLKRRNPRIWQMAYVAAARLLASIGDKPRSCIAGTALGALDETRNFLDGIFKDGFGSPTSFIASVHNSMAGKLALDFAIDGPNLTVCDGQNSFASAIASSALLPKEAFPCLVIAVDECIPLLRDLVPHLSPECRKGLSTVSEEGAVALLLSKTPVPGAGAVRAVMPSPLDDCTPQKFADSLVESFGRGEAMVSLLDSCTSFLSAALQVHAALVSGRPGKHIVLSYSPSSMACAAVEVVL